MSYRLLQRICICAVAALAWAGAAAHEFWMLPDRFAVTPGAAVSLSLHVGENFTGDRVGLSQPQVTAFRQYSSTGTVNLRSRLPALPAGEFMLVTRQAGSQLLVLDTQPNEIELPAEKFHSYVRDEGLDFIVSARVAAGTASLPGRERYRRNVKTLFQVGAPIDETYSTRTGQRLEVVPLSNPQRHTTGAGLSFQVFFDSRPLAGALVKFWHKGDGRTSVIKAVTNGGGTVTVTPPWPGLWMASVVHMVPATDSAGVDWDRYWGNMTFALP
jgi:uncharacterized GH25 family protein